MAAFVMIVMFVIPPFMNLYANYGANLPLPTRFLLFVNAAFRQYWYLVLLLVTGMVFAFKSYVNTKSGRYQWDYLMIKMPPTGSLFFNLSMSRFARILSQLLGSGVPILQSLQLVADTVGNTVIQKAIVSLQKSVNEGKGMSETMKRSGFFAPIVVQMVSIGEQTGKTEELLSHIAGYYEDQANGIIKNLSSLIEPILIFILGGMVLLLAMGVFLPTWNLVNVIK
jgi:MSHA biogenesis protein MshG